MVTTRTGHFPLGFRVCNLQGFADLTAQITFAKEQGFAALDVGPLPIDQLKQIQDAGLSVGTVDLPQPWGDFASPDAAVRQAVVDVVAQYIRDAAGLGVKRFFTVILIPDPAANRKEAFDLAVAGYSLLCDKVADLDVKIVIEGWPAGPPYYASLVCTPEAYRAFLDQTSGNVMAVNYDPSHLIRMGIDPVRFLEEFVDRVAHVHGKDTELFSDALYEFGNLQAPINPKPHGYGDHVWRYTIPGHGIAPWTRLFACLEKAGYKGLVSVELEDEQFNHSPQGEQQGLCASRDFLIYA